LIDGQTYRGKVAEYRSGGYLTLELEQGALLVFSDLEIEAIGTIDAGGKFSPAPATGSWRKAKAVYAFPEYGYFHHASFSFSFGSWPLSPREDIVFDPFFGPTPRPQSRTAIGFNVQYVGGFQFNRMLGIGGGLSFDGYNLEDGESMVTLFAHYRGYLTRSIVAPYLGLNAGYGQPFRNDRQGITSARGGWMIHPELGLRLGANDRTNFTVSVGYRFQQAEYTQVFAFNGDIQYRDITYKRLMFSMGLLF
jgi:hypothetical protein